MSKYVIVNGLPYLYAENGKTYKVRQDEKGLTIGDEVKFDKMPKKTYTDLSIKAKYHGKFDSIAEATEAQVAAPKKAARRKAAEPAEIAEEPAVEPIVVKENYVPVDRPEAISDTPDVVDTVAEAEEAAEAVAETTVNPEAVAISEEIPVEEPVEAPVEEVEEPVEPELELDGGAISGIEKALEDIHEKVDAAKEALADAREAAEEHLIEDMTVAELKAYAEEHGIDLKKARLKAEIVDAIKSAE